MEAILAVVCVDGDGSAGERQPRAFRKVDGCQGRVLTGRNLEIEFEISAGGVDDDSSLARDADARVMRHSGAPFRGIVTEKIITDARQLLFGAHGIARLFPAQG
jgi:hypothetical protein